MSSKESILNFGGKIIAKSLSAIRKSGSTRSSNFGQILIKRSKSSNSGFDSYDTLTKSIELNLDDSRQSFDSKNDISPLSISNELYKLIDLNPYW